MPTLHCEIGNHDYFRDPQRGRPPRNCPEHTPVVISRHLVGDHSAEKAITRLNTSQLQAILNPELQTILKAAEDEQKYETLICEVGDHEWQRERQRGKKPSRCPEHRSPAISAPPSNKTTDHQASVIAAILEAPRASGCRCRLSPTSTPAQIRTLGGGCTMPSFVCPILDTVRRQLNI